MLPHKEFLCKTLKQASFNDVYMVQWWRLTVKIANGSEITGYTLQLAKNKCEVLRKSKESAECVDAVDCAAEQSGFGGNGNVELNNGLESLADSDQSVNFGNLLPSGSDQNVHYGNARGVEADQNENFEKLSPDNLVNFVNVPPAVDDQKVILRKNKEVNLDAASSAVYNRNANLDARNGDRLDYSTLHPVVSIEMVNSMTAPAVVFGDNFNFGAVRDDLFSNGKKSLIVSDENDNLLMNSAGCVKARENFGVNYLCSTIATSLVSEVKLML